VDPETKKLLEENLAVSKENNKLIREVRKVQKRAQVVKVLYWAVVIIIGLGAYFAVAPYFNQLETLYTSSSSGLGNINDYLDTFGASQ